MQADFWLYVVEFARSPSRRRIWTIWNPAMRIDQFMFDAGWKAAVEPPDGVAAPKVVSPKDLQLMSE